MIIKKESIRRYFELFGDFGISISTACVVWLDAVSFEFDQTADDDPTNANLRELFREDITKPCDDECKKNKHRKNRGADCIEGTVHFGDFDDIKKFIDRCIITYTEAFPEKGTDPWGFLPAPPEIAKERLDTYWGMVEELFPLPPTRAYWFENTTGDYLGQQVFWGFTVVFLNDKTGKGIVLDGGTSD